MRICSLNPANCFGMASSADLGLFLICRPRFNMATNNGSCRLHYWKLNKLIRCYIPRFHGTKCTAKEKKLIRLAAIREKQLVSEFDCFINLPYEVATCMQCAHSKLTITPLITVSCNHTGVHNFLSFLLVFF